MRLKKNTYKFAEQKSNGYIENDPSTWPEIDREYHHAMMSLSGINQIIDSLQKLTTLEEDEGLKNRMLKAIDYLEKADRLLSPDGTIYFNKGV